MASPAGIACRVQEPLGRNNQLREGCRGETSVRSPPDLRLVKVWRAAGYRLALLGKTRAAGSGKYESSYPEPRVDPAPTVGNYGIQAVASTGSGSGSSMTGADPPRI